MIKNHFNAFERMPIVLPIGYIKESIGALYDGGLPKGLYTGLDNLDNVFRLDKGRLLTITGVPNYGKSEFVDFLTTTYNKRYGFKTLYFSPENQPVALHVAKLVRKFTNKPFDKNIMGENELNNALDYILSNFFFFNYQKVYKLEDIKKEACRIIDENGIDILVLDAYNKIESEMPSGAIETNFISNVLDELCDLAIRKNILVILVAHPKKMDWDSCKKTYKMPNAYDINGSANFFNKSDFVLVVHRENIGDEDKDTVIIRVEKVKFTNYGKTDIKGIKLKYDTISGNYYNAPDKLLYSEIEEEYKPIPFTIPESINDREPLDIEVSYYNGTTDTVGKVVKLKDILFSDISKTIVERIRNGKTPEERHSIKDSLKSTIPCYTIGGTFTKRNANSIEKPSGLISIDIDYKDNVAVIDKVPEILKNLPYITYYAKSISGDGYFAIIKLDNVNSFKSHFFALEKEFAEYGITLDKSCKDISRLRFVSYDSEAYYNPNATTYYYVDTEANGDSHTSVSDNRITRYNYNSTNTIDTIESAIRELKKTGKTVPDDYNTWFELGMSLSTLGDKGREYYHTISSLSSKYDRNDTEKQYDTILSNYGNNNNFSIGTAIKILNDSAFGNNNYQNNSRYE